MGLSSWIPFFYGIISYPLFWWVLLQEFSSYVIITRMISPVWFAFNGIGSIFNLILRLPQYASVSKMINGTRFVNTFFLVLCHTLIFWFLCHVYPCVLTFLCSGSTIWLVLFLKFYIKLLSLFLEFYIKLPFSRQKLFSLCKTFGSKTFSFYARIF